MGGAGLSMRLYSVAMTNATTHLVHHKDGSAYWVERRVGFRGIEWNYGAGWRTSRVAAFRLARDNDELRIPTREEN